MSSFWQIFRYCSTRTHFRKPSFSYWCSYLVSNIFRPSDNNKNKYLWPLTLCVFLCAWCPLANGTFIENWSIQNLCLESCTVWKNTKENWHLFEKRDLVERVRSIYGWPDLAQFHILKKYFAFYSLAISHFCILVCPFTSTILTVITLEALRNI